MRPDLFCMPIGQTMQLFKLHSWTTEDLLLLLNRTRPIVGAVLLTISILKPNDTK